METSLKTRQTHSYALIATPWRQLKFCLLYSPAFVRCPICHHVFNGSIPQAHFEKLHPEYNRWRRPFMRKFLLALVSPIIVIVAMGIVWGFANNLELGSLQFDILLSSFVPALVALVRYSLVNRKFRREWVASHGSWSCRPSLNRYTI